MTSANSIQTQRSRYDAQGTLREYDLWMADGRPFTHREYDADGHLLQDLRWKSDGALERLEKNLWVDGLQVNSVVDDNPGGTYPLVWHLDWTYNAQRQVVQRVDTRLGSTWKFSVHHLYIYENGRLARIDHLREGEESPSSSVYRYDEAGRLKGVLHDTSDEPCDDDVYRCASYAYDDSNHLRERHWTLGYEIYRSETYDAAGRVLNTSAVNNAIEPTFEYTKRQYDEAGRLIRREYDYSGWMSGDHSLTRSLYGDADLPLLEWSVRQNDGADSETIVRGTTRSTFICGTSRPYLKEMDEDGDRVVDSRCTYERDAAGRLVREQCVPVRDPSVTLSRVEYRYDCDAPAAVRPAP